MVNINYRELNIWKEAHELTLELLKFLEDNDLKRNYRLKDQIQGSSLSIGSNICEGSTGSDKETKRYFGIAKNSAKELEYQILVLKDMKYISIDTYTHFQKKIDKIIGGLSNYMKKLD